LGFSEKKVQGECGVSLSHTHRTEKGLKNLPMPSIKPPPTHKHHIAKCLMLWKVTPSKRSNYRNDRQRITGVAVAQPYFFKYKSQYLAKLDFKTTVLTSGCFFV